MHIITPKWRSLTAIALLVAANCILVGGATATGPHCAPPYVKVLDGAPAALPDPTNQYAIEYVAMGEPFVDCATKQLTIVFKRPTLDPSGLAVPPLNASWRVQFDTNATSTGSVRTIFVEYHTRTNPAGSFNWGFHDDINGIWLDQCPPVPVQPCAVTGTVTPDGTITMHFNVSSALPLTGLNEEPFGSLGGPSWTPGKQLTHILGEVTGFYGAAGTGVSVSFAQTCCGEYTLQGNLSCSSPPTAALSAVPSTGNAPLTVNFNASASSNTGGCGTIDSYTLDFGDGSSAVTQATPTFSHIYGTSGTYTASLTVANTVGLTSTNLAQALITVGGPPQCGTATWRIFPSPNFGAGNNELYGIDGASANDVWAVGRYNDATGYKTLSMRWGGSSAWNIVSTPNVGSAFNQLFSVAALSSNNAWAVGASSDNNVIHQPLIAHWDGTEWSVVPAALAPGSSAFLYGIAAIAADDIWAVGYIQVGFSAQQPLAMHWDGASWSLVPTPSTSPANRDILWAVSALATDNVWATGSSTDAVTGEFRTFIQHWNGSAWAITPSPNPSGSIYNFVWGIEAVSANDVWVMGRAYTGDAYPSLIERWNGSAWSITPSPSLQFYNELYDATALSSTDVWAVGRNGGGFSDNIAMVMHWNGSAWSVVANPNPPGATENNFLYSVDAISPQDVWAVGAYFKDQKFQTLIERYSIVPCISPSGAVSRKSHGAAGTFDINLLSPIPEFIGIECRTGGADNNYQVVLTFPTAVTVGGAAVTPATGGSASVSGSPILSPDGKGVTVNLTGVSNAQTVTITLLGVSDGIGTNDVAVQMGVLNGDTNANGNVSNSDVAAVKGQISSPVTASNFRTDVNANGNVSNTDVGVTKAQVSTMLP